MKIYSKIVGKIQAQKESNITLKIALLIGNGFTLNLIKEYLVLI
jgi:hypothetical protein